MVGGFSTQFFYGLAALRSHAPAFWVQYPEARFGWCCSQGR